MAEQSVQEAANRVAELLIARGQTVCVSESSCGGMISAALLAYPGASAYYRGGHVTYSVQSQKLYFPKALLSDLKEGKVKYGGEEMVRARARGIQAEMNTTWGIAETGQAGPTFVQINKPQGPYAKGGDGIARTSTGRATGVLAVAGDSSVGGYVQSTTVRTDMTDRKTNMAEFAKAALRLLENSICSTDGSQSKL